MRVQDTIGSLDEQFLSSFEFSNQSFGHVPIIVAES